MELAREKAGKNETALVGGFSEDFLGVAWSGPVSSGVLSVLLMRKWLSCEKIR